MTKKKMKPIKPKKRLEPWASMTEAQIQRYMDDACRALESVTGRRALKAAERAAFLRFLDQYLNKNGFLGADPRDMATVYAAFGNWFENPDCAPDYVHPSPLRLLKKSRASR